MMRLTVTTTTSYLFDPDRVAKLHAEIAPDPDLYGDDPACALFAYLAESMFGSDVFEDRGDFDQGYDVAEFDPDA